MDGQCGIIFKFTTRNKRMKNNKNKTEKAFYYLVKNYF